jgi:hypothetical protein
MTLSQATEIPTFQKAFFMTYDPTSVSLPAPCIVDNGILVNKDDIRRLLNDLGHVRYTHTVDGKVASEGEGWIVEVFMDANQATLVANHALYLNVQSFDYLQLHASQDNPTFFDLIQDSRQLRLIPLASNLPDPEGGRDLDPVTLEEMVTQVLSAKWDVQFDDYEDFPF